MTSNHRGVGHAGEDMDLNFHVEDTRNIGDNESTNSSETTIAFRGSEADGCLGNLPSYSQSDFTYSEEKYTIYINV